MFGDDETYDHVLGMHYPCPLSRSSRRRPAWLWRISALNPSIWTASPAARRATLVKANDEETYYLTAARNLALAESKRLPLLTPCNGCYSTFKSVLADLKVDWRLQQQVNEHLAEAGRALEGDMDVWHLVEWLSEDLGPAALSKRVSKPLWGMRIAVHYGCHLLRPSPAVRWDSPTAPTKFEAAGPRLSAPPSSTTRPRWSAAATPSTAWASARTPSAMMERKLADVREHEVRRSRGLLPLVLPAVRPEPGGHVAASGSGSKACERRCRCARLLHHRADRPGHGSRRGRAGPRHAPGGRGCLPGQVGAASWSSALLSPATSTWPRCRSAPAAAPATPTAPSPRWNQDFVPSAIIEERPGRRPRSRAGEWRLPGSASIA